MGNEAAGKRFSVYSRVKLHISLLYGIPEWMPGLAVRRVSQAGVTLGLICVQ